MAEQGKITTSWTQNAFNGGEMSEATMEARTDMDKYLTSALRMENAKMNKQGIMEKRQGTNYVRACKWANIPGRLIPFEFSRTTAFMLEFGDQYIRVFQTDGTIITTTASGTTGLVPYEVTTPYFYTQLFDIQYRQINDVMYLVHPDHQVRKLSRVADNNWTLETVDFAPPPFYDENLSDVYITPSWSTGATGTVGDTVTLTASVDSASSDDPSIFKQGHNDSIWQIRHLREGADVELDLSLAGTNESTVLPIIGEWNFRTYGFWSGVIKLQKKSSSDRDWRTIRQWSGENDRNVDAVPLDGGDPQEADYRIQFVRDAGWDLPTGVTENPRAVLEATEAFIGGLVKITSVSSDGTQAQGTVVKDLFSEDETTYWSEPLYSAYRGHPSAIDFYENRLWLGGTDDRPLNFQGSVSDSYEDFTYGDANDDQAINKRIGAYQQNPIRWLGSLSSLLIGSATEIWGHMTEDGGILTPSSGSIRRQTSKGSKAIQPLTSDDVLIFIHSSGLRVYELALDGRTVLTKHTANDLTILADHIPGTGITNTAIEREPETRIWVVNEDGEIGVMTYERDHNVAGWVRHLSALGDIESVAVVSEEVWVIVKRQLSGVDVRYIEKYDTVDWERDGQKYAQFVDSAVKFGPGATGTVTTISNARPAVVTGEATGLVDNDLIEINGVLGMTKVNSETLMVKTLSTLGSGDETWELYESDGVTPFDTRLATAYSITGSAIASGAVYTDLTIGSGHDLVVGDLVQIASSSGTSMPSGLADPLTASVVATSADTVTVNVGLNGTLAYDFTGCTVALSSGSDAYGSGSVGVWKEVYSTLTGLEHLNGQSVQAFSDGGFEGEYTVAGGQITLTNPGSYVLVGLQEVFTYKSMRLDVTPVHGNMQGRVKRIDELVVRVENSGPFEYSADGVTWWDARVNTYDESPWGQTPDFFTGDVRLNWPGNYDSENHIYIRQEKPLPLRIKAITIKYQLTGK